MIKGEACSRNRFTDPSPSLDWRQRAACRGYPSELWEAGGYDQLELLLVAEQICYNCPVMLECERSATKGDLQYSMRGGRMPTEQPTRPQGRPSLSRVKRAPSGGPRSSMLDRGKCARDHEIKGPENLSSDGRCLICKRDDQEAVRRMKGIPKRGTKTHCWRGHELTPENVYSPPCDPARRECRKCISARKRKAGTGKIVE